MPSAENANIVLNALKRSGIGLVASLPDAFLVNVLEAIGSDNEIQHVPLTREEEGVGVCTGAYLGGKRCALVMQNAGLLNACNGLTTTALQMEIPMLLLVLYAGARGDISFPMLGQVTEPVLSGLKIPYYIPANISEVPDMITSSVIQAYNTKKPVAVLLHKWVL
jgi:sulfopyruvate decarboxylase subunit alpha